MRVLVRQQATAIRQFELNRKRAHFKTQEFYNARQREYRRVIHGALRFCIVNAARGASLLLSKNGGDADSAAGMFGSASSRRGE
jgi:hypothetical protein